MLMYVKVFKAGIKNYCQILYIISSSCLLLQKRTEKKYDVKNNWSPESLLNFTSSLKTSLFKFFGIWSKNCSLVNDKLLPWKALKILLFLILINYKLLWNFFNFLVSKLFYSGRSTSTYRFWFFLFNWIKIICFLKNN